MVTMSKGQPYTRRVVLWRPVGRMAQSAYGIGSYKRGFNPRHMRLSKVLTFFSAKLSDIRRWKGRSVF